MFCERGTIFLRELFDITKFDLYKEDNRREVKKANGGLPASLWQRLHSVLMQQRSPFVL